MESEVYKPRRTWKLRVRILLYCFSVSLLLAIPFGTAVLSWQLGFYPSIGQPLVVIPKEVNLAISLGIIISFLSGFYGLTGKHYNLSGGLFCLGLILLWVAFRKVYNPIYLARWLYSYWHIPGLQAAIRHTLTYSGGYVIALTASGMLLFKRRAKQASGAYGTAELEYGDELAEELDGLLVGRHIQSDKLLRYNGNRHLITIAPTRSGKGVSSIIPNILTYPKNLVVVDPKGENCDYTYHRRQEMGQNVYVLDPFSISNYARQEGANSFNPLDSVGYQSPAALEYCNDIRGSIITSNPHNLNDFWMQAAQTMYSGFLYYITQAPEFNDPAHRNYKPHLRRLTTVNDLLKLKLEDLLVYTENISDADNIPLQVKKVANDILSDSESKKMLGSIIKTLQVNIEFMDSPYLRESLKSSDFAVEDIISDDSTLYIILPPDKIRLYRSWLKMVIELLIKRTTQLRNPKNPNNKENTILFIIDEFANIGRMNYVKDSYSVVAGYGMQMWTILQNISQLKNTYDDDWQTFISNSGVVQTFGANEMETAKYISQLMGETTAFSLASTNQTKTGGAGLSDDTGMSYRVDERQRPLKTPDEVIRLPGDRQILKLATQNPVLSRKITYYNDPEFEGTYTTREDAYKQAKQAPLTEVPPEDMAAERDLMQIIRLNGYNRGGKEKGNEQSLSVGDERHHHVFGNDKDKSHQRP